jgi:polar amino acid transport system substrate-binding protein
LKAALNTALAKIKADGTYAAIVHKWFGADAQ